MVIIVIMLKELSNVDPESCSRFDVNVLCRFWKHTFAEVTRCGPDMTQGLRQCDHGILEATNQVSYLGSDLLRAGQVVGG